MLMYVWLYIQKQLDNNTNLAYSLLIFPVLMYAWLYIQKQLDNNLIIHRNNVKKKKNIYINFNL